MMPPAICLRYFAATMGLTLRDTYGALQLNDPRKLIGYFLAFLSLMTLACDLLWIRPIWRKGISYSEVSIFSLCGHICAGRFIADDLIYSIGYLVVLFFIGRTLYKKWDRALDAEKQEANLRSFRALDIFLLKCILNSIGLLAGLIAAAVMWIRPHFRIWAIFPLLPSLWFGWKMISYLVASFRTNNLAEPSN